MNIEISANVGDVVSYKHGGAEHYSVVKRVVIDRVGVFYELENGARVNSVERKEFAHIKMPKELAETMLTVLGKIDNRSWNEFIEKFVDNQGHPLPEANAQNDYIYHTYEYIKAALNDSEE